MLENPIVLAALICFLLGFVLSGLVRIFHALPPHQPYCRLFSSPATLLPTSRCHPFLRLDQRTRFSTLRWQRRLLGLVLDLLPRTAVYRRLLAVIIPLLIVGWIGFPRFAKPDIELIATALGLWLGGIALLWRLDTVATAPPEHNGGSIVGTAMLMGLLLAFAPVALLGGSSTSLMLCLAAVVGLAAAALWEIFVPRGAFGASAVFGVGCGLLAMIDTVTLITREVDLVALALLLLIPYSGEVSARLLLPQNRFRGRFRQILVGIFAASPLLLVIAVLFFRHRESMS